MRKLILVAVVLVLAVGAWWWSAATPPPVPTLERIEVPATPAPSPATIAPSEPASPAPAAPRPKAAAPKAMPPPAATPTPVEAAPTTGSLHIVADVPEASVFIDRKFIGTAPVTATDIAPGPHRLNVSVAGYDAISQDIDVTPGPREIAIAFKEVRLSASVAVTHKHAMGSCAGTLRASPQGVTYETSNKGDAFTVALADIEIFEVDYLAKNLKLKIRKGKTYNFTDPDGNADRLFVFHRDVNKVRVR
jgi:hypothetical protein